MNKTILSILALTLLSAVSLGNAQAQDTGTDLTDRIQELETQNQNLKNDIKSLASLTKTLIEILQVDLTTSDNLNGQLDILYEKESSINTEYYQLLDDYDFCATELECRNINNQIEQNDNKYFNIQDQLTANNDQWNASIKETLGKINDMWNSMESTINQIITN